MVSEKHEEFGSLGDTASEYRRLNGLPDEPQHIDDGEEIKTIPQPDEPEGGYGGPSEKDEEQDTPLPLDEPEGKSKSTPKAAKK